MPTAPFDDPLPGGDDRARLLTLEHRLRDLGRVGQVADARLEHLDARLRQPILDFRLHVLRHRGGIAAQRHLILFVGVVLVARREVAHRGLGLHLHEVLIVVDFEDGFGGVDDAPDDDGGDLDRIAFEVVDLQLGALEVTHAKRNALLRVERVGPAQSRRFRRADVVAEELQDAALVRIDDEDPDEQEACDEDEQRLA